MAGLGYKDFTAGAVLTAAQVDGYLMEQAVMNFAGTAARGSALASVQAAGMVAHVGGGTVTVATSGSAWAQMYPVLVDWTSYTPALTAATTNPTLGTGSTAVGAYAQIGKLVIFRLRITFGSSGTNAGSGEYRLTLPVAADVTNYSTAGGSLSINDNSTNIFRAARPLGWASNTSVAFAIDSTTSGTYMVTNSNPWTWAAYDEIGGQLIYQAA